MINFLSRLVVASFVLVSPSLGHAQSSSDLSATVSFSPATVKEGGLTSVTIAIGNSSGAPLGDIAISGLLDAGASVAQGTIGNTCGGTVTAAAGSSTVDLAAGSLAASSSCQITVPVNAADSVTLATFSPGDLVWNGGSEPAVSPATLTIEASNLFRKSLSTSSLAVGEITRVTHTFSTAGTISGGFVSESLPMGLELANPVFFVSDCLVGNQSGGSGDRTLSYSISASGTTCTAEFDVKAVAAGSYALTNTFSGTEFSSPSVNSFSDTYSTGLVVSGPAANTVSLSKVFPRSRAAAGETVPLQFTITNTSRAGDATALSFSDDLNAMLSGTTVANLTSEPCGTGSSLSGSSTLSLSGGSVASGDSCTFTVDVVLPSNAASVAVTNTTSALTGLLDGSSLTSSAAQAVLNVSGDGALPIVLAKEFDGNGAVTGSSDPIAPGDVVNLVYTLTNPNSAADATGISFSQTAIVPTGVTFGSATTNDCNFVQTTVNLTGAPMFLNGSLLAGQSCTIVLPATFDTLVAPGTYTSTTGNIAATVGGQATEGGGASTTFTVQGGASLQLTKSFAASNVVAGDTVNMTLRLESADTSASTATAIAFTDDLDGFLGGTTLGGVLSQTCVGTVSGTGTGTLTYSGGTLAPDQFCEIEVALNVASNAVAGSYTNSTSQVTATAGGVSVFASGASDQIQVLPATLPVISKQIIGGPFLPGQTVTVSFSMDHSAGSTDFANLLFVENVGAAISGATVSNLTPNGFCGAGSTANLVGSVIQYTGLQVLAGQSAASCSFSYDVLIPSGATDADYLLRSSAMSATVNGASASLPNVDASLLVQTDGLRLVKSFSPQIAGAGEDLTLSYTLTNDLGGSAVSSVAFSDDLDASLSGLTAVQQSSDCSGVNYGGSTAGNLSISDVSLAANASCTITYTATIPAGASSGLVAGTTSAITGLTDPGAVAVSGLASRGDFTVRAFEIPSFSKVFTPDQVGFSDSLSLVYSITNNDSSATLTDLQFVDTLSSVVSGLSVTSVTPGLGCSVSTANASSGTVTVQGLEIAPSTTCQITAAMTMPSSGSTGSVTSTTSDLVSNGLILTSGASDMLTVAPSPVYSMAVSPATVAQGGISTLTYTVDNSLSAYSAGSLTVQTALPSGVLVAPTPNASTTCSGGTLNAVAGGSSILYGATGSVAAGGTCTISVDVRSVSATAVVIPGTIDSATGPQANRSATLTMTPAPALTLSKAFDTVSIAPNTSSTMTLTIGNTAGLIEATGLAITDTFPSGMTIDGVAATTCTGGTLTAVSGSSLLSYSGGTVAASSSCKITVDVTLSAAGSFVNSTGDLTSSRGTTSGASATLRAPGITLSTPIAGNNVVSQAEAGAVTVSGTTTQVEDGQVVTLTVTDSGGTPVNFNVSVSGNSWSTTLNLAPFADGSIQVSARATDANGAQTGSAGTTLLKDATAPTGQTVSFDPSVVNVANQGVVSFSFANAEVGAGYAYSITSSGGGTAVTGSGTVTMAADQITALDLSGLGDGTLTVSLVLTDGVGNAASAVTGTVTKDATAPTLTIDSPLAADDVVNDAEAATVVISGASGDLADGQQVQVVVTDSASASVSGAATVASAVWSVTLDLSSLADGALTVTADTSDIAGNPAVQATAALSKDTTAPVGYMFAFDQSSVNQANQTAISFTFAGAEVGASYSYTVTSAAGGAPVTGTGTIATASDQITGLVLSGLNDGLLTLSVALTDPAGNSGVTGSTVISKDVSAPMVGFDTPLATDNIVNAAEAPAVTISGSGGAIADGQIVTVVVTDSASATVTGPATIASGAWSAALDLSTLADGGLSLTADVMDLAGNPAVQATSSLSKDTVAPVGYAASFDQGVIGAANQTAVSFTFEDSEVGASFSYTVTSDAGGTPVTGTGVIATGIDQVSGLDVTALLDGTLTLSVALTDPAGNVGTAVTATTPKDVAAPTVSIDTPLMTDDIVNAAEVTMVTVSGRTAGLEDGQIVSLALADSLAGSVLGQATTAGGIWSAQFDLSSLSDGPLTVTADASDVAGNAATQAVANLQKDTQGPSGLSVTIDQNPVNLSNVSAVSFSFTGGEVGASFAVTLSSSGGGPLATESGTVPVSTGAVSGFDLTPLPDGTLTLSVVQTDVAGNPGAGASDTSIKDTLAASVSLDAPTDPQSDPFSVTATFDEDVTGLSLAGLVIDNGTASALTGSAASYSFTVTPDHDGEVTIEVAAGAAQDLRGNDNTASDPVTVLADLTGTPNPVSLQDADGDGVPDIFESSTADRDGDGIPDNQDYDPQGYFYCEDDGRIISGGGITVTGPSGSNSSVGLANDIRIVETGASGSYQWFATRPGTYSVSYSYPANEGLPSTARLSSGTLDVTSILPSNPGVIGSTEFGSTGALADGSLAANPVFYSSFIIEAGDPNVLANNIPMTQCAENPVVVSTAVNGAEANSGTPSDISFTVAQDRVSLVDTVLSYTVIGTAQPGTDYTAPSGTVTIPAGELTATVDITVLEDGIIEGTEAVTFTLTSVTAGDTATALSTTAGALSAVATIADDDTAVISVRNDDLTASEGSNDTGAMSFVLLGQPTSNVVLNFAGDSQCRVSPATLTFTAANYTSAQTLTISAIDDEDVEGTHICQPSVSVSSADPAYSGFSLTLAQVIITDDLVDQIRDPLTEILKDDLQQTVQTQQRSFSRIAKGALGRLQAGMDDVACGTISAPDVDGNLNISDGTGSSEGKFGWDVYNCHTMRREILDGSFSLNWTAGSGTQAMLQFSRQSEKMLSEQELRGFFWGGYYSRNTVEGLAEGTIDGFGVNGGVYGAKDFGTGLFLDYYASAALGTHSYELTFDAVPGDIDASGSYRYAAIFGGAALSGTRDYETFSVSPRVGIDLAYAWVSDADVTATQLGRTDTGTIDLPDFSGGRIYAEIEFASLSTKAGTAALGKMLTETSFTPRLSCEHSSYDQTSDCGAGINLAITMRKPNDALSYGVEIDYERMSDVNRLTLDFTRERRFARGQGAVVTRLSMPTADSVSVEHGVQLDW